MDVPRDIDLSNRLCALDQLGVAHATHARIAAMVNEALHQQEATFFVSARQRPLLAARSEAKDGADANAAGGTGSRTTASTVQDNDNS
ncbi:hypothetical protein [Streptomyces sp. NPDC059460]|uniref:hypothetical protein n=1 Tax=Streptomyces sp. NPDC059460 TaxID=3346840 RepID=UPI0036B585BD